MAVAIRHTAKFPRQETPDRAPEIRRNDFQERRQVPNIVTLFQGAKRCCDCKLKGCNRDPEADITDKEAKGCPLNVKIPNWLNEVAGPAIEAALSAIMAKSEAGELTWDTLNNTVDALRTDPLADAALFEAFRHDYERNPLPEFLGLVCPQPEGLCEGGSQRAGNSCVAGRGGHEPITIGNIENIIGYIGRRAGWFEESLQTPVSMKQRISIIGAGPGGLAAAVLFRRAGYEVNVYTREQHIGGLLMYGLPGTKLSKETVLAYEKIFLQNQGIKLHTGVDVDAAKMGKIEDNSDIVILALGAQEPKKLGIAGEDLNGVVQSLDFLGESIRVNNIRALGASDEILSADRAAELNAKDRHVVVIGGGDTSADCVSDALRQGAVSVKLVYRGEEADMRAIEKEKKRIKAEGIDIKSMQLPERIEGGESVIEVIFTQNVPQSKITAGQTLQNPGEEIYHKADLLINAIGFNAAGGLAQTLGIAGLQQAEGNNGIKVHKPGTDYRLSLNDGDGPDRPSSKFYAIGDVVQIGVKNGPPNLAVWAVHNAVKVFEQVDRLAKFTPL